jgi:hypothetical protein
MANKPTEEQKHNVQKNASIASKSGISKFQNKTAIFLHSTGGITPSQAAAGLGPRGYSSTIINRPKISNPSEDNIISSSSSSSSFYGTMQITYGFNGGTDLDTKTDLDNGLEVAGYACGGGGTYITSFFDDTDTDGAEIAIIDYEQFFLDYPGKSSVMIELHGCWYEGNIGGTSTALTIHTPYQQSTTIEPVIVSSNGCCDNLLVTVELFPNGSFNLIYPSGD